MYAYFMKEQQNNYYQIKNKLALGPSRKKPGFDHTSLSVEYTICGPARIA